MKLLSVVIAIVTQILAASYANASHIIGGEISYTYLGNNQYQITMKIYRDCYNGQAPFDNPAYYTIFNGNGDYITNGSVALSSDDTINLPPPDLCDVAPGYVCTEIGIYQYTLTLPPSATGYQIAYQRCCRACSVINLSNPCNQGSTYVSFIPDSVYTTNNNSPYSNSLISPYFCILKPLSIDASVTDPDGDSIVYEFCSPYSGATNYNPEPIIADPPPYSAVSYNAPYTATYPMSANPALAINPSTGEITGTPTAYGTYVIGICAHEFRNGIQIGDFRRDFITTVVDCGMSQIGSMFQEWCGSGPTSMQFYNNSNASTYHWDFGDPSVTTDTSDIYEPTYLYTVPGNYVVTCIATTASCVDTGYLYLHWLDDNADFSYSNAYVQQPVSFTDLSAPTFGNITSWNWNFGDLGTSTSQNPVHTYNSLGVYNVTLIIEVDDFCPDTIIKQIGIFGTGLQETGSSASFIVYPNPAKDYLTILLSPIITGEPIFIELVDEMGRKVKTITEINGKNTFQIPVSNLSRGIYAVKVSSEKGLIGQRIISFE